MRCPAPFLRFLSRRAEDDRSGRVADSDLDRIVEKPFRTVDNWGIPVEKEDYVVIKYMPMWKTRPRKTLLPHRK